MQTFESGGALLINPGAPVRKFVAAFGLGGAVLVFPPLIGIYLLLIA